MEKLIGPKKTKISKAPSYFSKIRKKQTIFASKTIVTNIIDSMKGSGFSLQSPTFSTI